MVDITGDFVSGANTLALSDLEAALVKISKKRIIDLVRVAAGFIVAPYVCGYVYTASLLGINYKTFSKFLVFNVRGTYALALILFLPIYLYLRRANKISAWNLVRYTFLLGFLPTLVLTLWELMAPPNRLYAFQTWIVADDGNVTAEGARLLLWNVFLNGMSAAVGGFIFWLFAHWSSTHIRTRFPRKSAADKFIQDVD